MTRQNSEFEDDDGVTVEGAIDQAGEIYVIVRKGGKTAYVLLRDFLLGQAAVMVKLAEQGVLIILPAQQRRIRELVDSIDKPNKRILVAERPGWLTRTAFVLPDGTIIARGAVRAEGVVRTFNPVPGFEASGSLDDWKSGLGPLLRGQHLLQGLLAYGLAALLLRDFASLAGIIDNPMLNIIGPSSTGKSTAARLVGSLYGTRTLGTWLTTANATEDYLHSRADCALILDEAHLAGADSRSRANLLGSTTMLLASGQGKARKGQPPLPLQRLLVLSTSNTHLLSGAANAAAIDPALQVRMPAIDLLGRPHGILDVVPGGDAAAIVNAINRAAPRGAGAPIRAFLLRLTGMMATDPERLRLLVNTSVEVFNRVARRHGPLSSLEERIIGRFALADAAGTLARLWGVFPAEWKYNGSGVLKMFLMARDTLRATAHTDPIARFELALRSLRPRLKEEGPPREAGGDHAFVGRVARRQDGGLELVMRRDEFVARFDSIHPRLLHLLRDCGALVVEGIGRDGDVRFTVKRQVEANGSVERAVAIRLDPRAYPAALKVRRID